MCLWHYIKWVIHISNVECNWVFMLTKSSFLSTPYEVGDRETGIKEESLVGCHGVAVGHLALEAHPEGGACRNERYHVDTGRKTSQTCLEVEI